VNPPTAPPVAPTPAASPDPAISDAGTVAAQEPEAGAAGKETVLGWTSGDLWFFSIVAAVLLVALSIQAVRLSGWGLSPIPIDRPENRKYEFQLDVNTATWVEWMQLDGIGESLGRRIVADREANGPFRSVDEVSRVKGIGEAKLAAMRPWLRYSEATAVARRAAPNRKAPSDGPPTQEP
jgi:competence protein ComEA